MQGITRHKQKRGNYLLYNTVAFLHEFKGHAIIARKGGEPGNEARP